VASYDYSFAKAKEEIAFTKTVKAKLLWITIIEQDWFYLSSVEIERLSKQAR
jgi:hypothetical protein